MKNFIQKGEVITIQATADTISGEVVLVGTIIGIAVKSVLTGGELPLAIEGVVELPKATGAITLGAKLYWDDTAKDVTTTVAANALAGYAISAQATGDPTVLVKLIF